MADFPASRLGGEGMGDMREILGRVIGANAARALDGRGWTFDERTKNRWSLLAKAAPG